VRAAAVAADLATKYQAPIVVISVFNPTVIAVPSVTMQEGGLFYGFEMDEISDAVHIEAEKAVTPVLTAAGVKFRCLREIGHPVDRIVATVEEEKCDLVIIGSRGRGDFKSFLMGSVSTGVLHHTPVDVLVVKEPSPAQE